MIVIEEYIGPERDEDADVVAAGGPSIVVVSARNEDRLKEQVRQLLAALRNPEAEPARLPAAGERLRLCDVAYTLQVGREAMECRLACVVPDLDAAVRAARSMARRGQGGRGFVPGPGAPAQGSAGVVCRR